MKSIKRGRGPSIMDGVGSIVGAIFGVIWTVSASSMGAPDFFTLFGVVFIAISLGSALYEFYNATRKNRFSEYDITEDGEEMDELNRYFSDQEAPEQKATEAAAYCPFCGQAAEPDHRFCSRCGKPLK